MINFKCEKFDINNRMSEYEKSSKYLLTKNLPVIVRLELQSYDIKNRFKLYSDIDKCLDLMAVIGNSMLSLLKGCDNNIKFSFFNITEINILLENNQLNKNNPYFNNDIQKIISTLSSKLASLITINYGKYVWFESKCFILPKFEIQNYFNYRKFLQVQELRNIMGYKKIKDVLKSNDENISIKKILYMSKEKRNKIIDMYNIDINDVDIIEGKYIIKDVARNCHNKVNSGWIIVDEYK